MSAPGFRQAPRRNSRGRSFTRAAPTTMRAFMDGPAGSAT